MAQDRIPSFPTRLAHLLKARFPCLYLCTWEEDRALAAIRKVAKDEALIKTPRSVFVWSVTSGLSGDGRAEGEDSKSPIKALEFAEKHAEAAVFVFKDFHVYFGGAGRPADQTVVRKIRDLVPTLKRSQRPKSVIFLCPSLVLPTDLQKDMTVVDFELPSFAEIRTLLEEMVETNRATGRIRIDLNADETGRLSKAALGLTLQEAENAFARAMVEDGQLNIQDLEVILDEKCQVIKKSEILEFIKSDLRMDDVGGLENLKRWLKKRDKSWLDEAQCYGLPAPKGVLITGVPGCGKSLIAKAISAAWQLPLLRLDVGKIYSGLMGSSEENMRKAIKTAEAIAPSVLWIDEIEKGFPAAGGGGDSGVSSRVFGSFLTWMQEKTKPVFVVATANNIGSLPPEFLRKGRFDEIFFVDLPTQKERADIFTLHLKKRLTDPKVVGNFNLSDAALAELTNSTEGYVGAEIEQVVISGLFDAFADDRAVRLEDFVKAVKNMVPLSVTQAEQIRSIREWANVRAVAATAPEHRSGYSPAQPKERPPREEGRDIIASRGGRAVDF